jgi:hypothetical protein
VVEQRHRTWVWWTAAAVALTLVVLDAAYQLRSGVGRPQVAATLAGYLAELTVGLLFWMWRRNLIGPLIVTYVVVNVIPDQTLIWPHSRLAWTLYYPSQFLWQPLWVWMLLAFPSGRLWNRASAWLVVYMAALLTLVPIPEALFQSQPRTYLFLGHGWSGPHFYTWFWGVMVFMIWIPFAVFAIARILSTPPGARRRFIPLYACSTWTVLFIVPSFAWFFLTAKSFSGSGPPTFPHGGQSTRVRTISPCSCPQLAPRSGWRACGKSAARSPISSSSWAGSSPAGCGTRWRVRWATPVSNSVCGCQSAGFGSMRQAASSTSPITTTGVLSPTSATTSR